jgi:hypothetical protein
VAGLLRSPARFCTDENDDSAAGRTEDLKGGLEEVAASLPPTALAQGVRQLQRELDRLAGA